MTAKRDLEGRLADYYEGEAPSRAPDWLLTATLATVETTRQRRGLGRLAWFPVMPSSAKAIVAAALVISVAAGLSVVRPNQQPNGFGQGSPTASPSVPRAGSGEEGRTSADLPPLRVAFTSARFGISIAYPSGWNLLPATDAWTGGIPTAGSGTADVFFERESDSPFIAVSSTPLSNAEPRRWISSIGTSAVWEDACVAQPITIDGSNGSLFGGDGCSGPMRAVTSAGGRGYLVVAYRIDDVEWFKGLLATVRLHPEDAID